MLNRFAISLLSLSVLGPFAVASDPTTTLNVASAGTIANVEAIAQSALAAVDPDDPTELDRAFVARFGKPTSRQFLALSARDRAAFQRYFLYGRGAAVPNGEADRVPVTPNGSVGPGNPVLVYGDPVPGFPGMYNCMLANTGSGYAEFFALQLPHTIPPGGAPALVAFHAFNVSHADAVYHTNFPAECLARNWFMIAPFGASQTNFGSLPSQINVAAVLSWARAMLPIDGNRIYGVGFSMGGGGCASYAARHLDPSASMFAAIVDHTGTVSLAHAYANESTSIQLILEGWFGGSPAAQPFAYQRCSTIDIDPLTEQIGVGTDMSRNLRTVHCWLADNDPQPYLPLQTHLFYDHIHAANPADVLTIVPGNVHSWSTLDDTVACDWLSRYTLQELTIGNTLADQDGTWGRFIVQQSAPGAFTPFSWHADAPPNRLSLWATANLQRLSVNLAPLGLVYSGNLKLNMTSADGTGDQVLFLGVPHAPTAVTRNGVPNATCVYDHAAHTFLVNELSGSGALWVFTF
jgi:dienelactone hydrolase